MASKSCDAKIELAMLEVDSTNPAQRSRNLEEGGTGVASMSDSWTVGQSKGPITFSGSGLATLSCSGGCGISAVVDLLTDSLFFRSAAAMILHVTKACLLMRPSLLAPP